MVRSVRIAPINKKVEGAQVPDRSSQNAKTKWWKDIRLCVVVGADGTIGMEDDGHEEVVMRTLRKKEAGLRFAGLGL